MSDEPRWLERLEGRLELWAERLKHRFLLWAEGLEHRMHRGGLVYRLELADAFVAFDREDYQRAHELFREFAEKGDPAAQFNLGTLCESGWGTPKSDKAAECWYRKAAEEGLADAQFQLAALLAADLVARDGGELSSPWLHPLRREPQDEKDDRGRYIEAYSWVWLARRQKFRPAKTALNRLGKHMSADEVAKGRRLAQAWWMNKGLILGNIGTRRAGGLAEGFRRFAIVIGILCAFLGAVLGAVLAGGMGWSVAGVVAFAGLCVLGYLTGWGVVRVLGWIVQGFLPVRNS